MSWKINTVSQQGWETVQRHLDSSRIWFHNIKSDLKAIYGFPVISGSPLQACKVRLVHRGEDFSNLVHNTRKTCFFLREGERDGGQLSNRKIFFSALQISREVTINSIFLRQCFVNIFCCVPALFWGSIVCCYPFLLQDGPLLLLAFYFYPLHPYPIWLRREAGRQSKVWKKQASKER